MKRIPYLLVALLASAISLYAEDMGKANDMTGWFCNSKCVTRTRLMRPVTRAVPIKAETLSSLTITVSCSKSLTRQGDVARWQES